MLLLNEITSESRGEKDQEVMSDNTKHVLLVENNDAHAELICQAFASQAEHMDLAVVCTLKEARQHIANTMPDLVIVDFSLPDGKGNELLPEDKEAAAFPVVMMNSHGDEKVAVETIKSGAMDYVVKSEAAMIAMPRIAGRVLREWKYIVERRRAEDEIRQRNRELTLLNRVIEATAASTNPEVILEVVCRELAIAFGVPQATATLLDEDNATATVIAEHRYKDWPSRLHQAISLTENSAFHYLFNQKTALVSSDIQTDDRLASLQGMFEQSNTVSLLLLPIIIEEEMVGSLCLETNSPREFSPEELRLARSVADQVSGALDRARLEEERRRLEAQYHQAQKMEAIGQLAAGIAHDFNNLLTAMNGFAEMIQFELEPDDPIQELAGKIRHSGESAAELVRQLLAFSRKQLIEPKVLNLNTLVENMSKILERLIQENISLETNLAPGLWLVKVDPAQIEQVVVNLAVNARDAMAHGGRLTIETANVVLGDDYATQHMDVQPGEHVMLAISDTGQGMSQEIQEHIFEPFFTTKEMGKGTGLGLATIFGVVKQSGGDIWVYSEEGVGTTFKVYLPRAAESRHSEGRLEHKGGKLSGHETILFVEDDMQVRELVRLVLRGQGYNLLEAKNGQQALRLVDGYNGPIHLLLTDVIMPGMSGNVLAEQLSQIRPDLKTLFMSGYTDNMIAQHGILESGIALLQKPFNSTDLSRKVRLVLDT